MFDQTESCTPYPDFQRLGRGLVITGTHWLVLVPASSLSATIRPLQHRIYSQLFTTFAALAPTSTSADFFATHAASRRFANVDNLPANVELMTLQAWDSSNLLLRLEHTFGQDEDTTLSQPVTVDLAKLIIGTPANPTVTEMSLTVTNKLEDINRLQWISDSTPTYVTRGGLKGTIATLTQMEIRSYFLPRQ